MEVKSIRHDHQLDENKELRPLTMVMPGKPVNLVCVNGGPGLKNRLYSMGLTPGVELRVLNNGAPGPFLVGVRDFKIALGYGVARKILVR